MDNTFHDEYVVPPQVEAERQQARLAVAARSIDTEDCRKLLQMLGLVE